MRLLTKSDIATIVGDIAYAKDQLEYINGCVKYFDKSGISKSVTEASIERLNRALTLLYK